MATFTDDSRIGTELMYPRRKPVGRVKIDWSNPLTRGLVYCFLLRQSSENLVEGGAKASTVGAPYLSTGIRPTVDDYVTTDDSPYYAESTFIAGITANSAPASGAESDVINKFKMHTMSWNHSSAAFRAALAINDGAWKSALFNITTAGKFNLASTVKSSSLAKAYKNGEFQNSVAVGTIADSPQFIVIGRNSELINDAFDGDVHYSYIFNRELAAKEVELYDNDPYRIFIPDIGA